MYRAKTSGKARWSVYDPDMRTAAVERLQLETDLVGALEAGHFALVFQPVVTLETEPTHEVSALRRRRNFTDHAGRIHAARVQPVRRR
jgi:predicted signal transduction protein with EAL and GGDEF domain